jgi:sarcosine oxidase
MSASSPNSSDVIVIGAGVAGANAAHQMARRGARVRLIEQFQINHANGSSHGPSRIIRLAYLERHYVALAQAAYALWREMESESGEKLLYTTGGLDFGEPDALELNEIGENYVAMGIPYDAVDAREIMRRFPQFRLPESFIGFYQPDYAMLAAERCVATAVALARRHGAVLHENTVVRAITPRAGGVTVRTDDAVYSAERLVICAGSWIPILLQSLGLDLPLTVTKEQVLFMRAADPESFAIGRFPLFIHRTNGSTSLGSGFPALGHSCPKLMLDRIGPRKPPGDADKTIEPDLVEIVRDYALGILPGLTGEIAEAVSCRYTMTPDEDFVIDHHPEHKQIVFASPCSGHGFKFGPVLGQILADLALTGASAHDVSRFRASRFAASAASDA